MKKMHESDGKDADKRKVSFHRGIEIFRLTNRVEHKSRAALWITLENTIPRNCAAILMVPRARKETVGFRPGNKNSIKPSSPVVTFAELNSARI